MNVRRSSVYRVIGLGCLALAIVAASASSNVGCDGGDDGTGGSGCVDAKGCFDYGCYTPGKARSFKADVLPIFEQSCSLSSSCHGNPKSPTTSDGYQPYLGEVDPTAMTPSDIAKILGVIVSQPSPTAMGMNIVEPGSPEKSFLMLKMDGDVACGLATCSFDDCGEGMPSGVKPLPQATRDTIRDWIKQGAQNN